MARSDNMSHGIFPAAGASEGPWFVDIIRVFQGVEQSRHASPGLGDQKMRTREARLVRVSVLPPSHGLCLGGPHAWKGGAILSRLNPLTFSAASDRARQRAVCQFRPADAAHSRGGSPHQRHMRAYPPGPIPSSTHRPHHSLNPCLLFTTGCGRRHHL
jgi:hypothetical protein